jgi:hypothetical protein
MLDVLSARWELVLSAHAFCWVRRPLWGREPAQCVAAEHFEAPLSEAERLSALAAFLQTTPVRYQGVRVSVDASWLYAAQVAPLANATRWPDIQAYTQLRLQEIFEVSQPLQVVCEPRTEGPYWASAMLQSHLHSLRSLLGAQRLALVACVPQWTVVWNHAAPALEETAVLLLHDRSTTLVLTQQGRVMGVQHWPFAAKSLSGPQWVALWRQAVRRYAMPEPAHWGVVGPVHALNLEDLKLKPLGSHADVLTVWGVQP